MASACLEQIFQGDQANHSFFIMPVGNGHLRHAVFRHPVYRCPQGFLRMRAYAGERAITADRITEVALHDIPNA